MIARANRDDFLKGVSSKNTSFVEKAIDTIERITARRIWIPLWSLFGLVFGVSFCGFLGLRHRSEVTDNFLVYSLWVIAASIFCGCVFGFHFRWSKNKSDWYTLEVLAKESPEALKLIELSLVVNKDLREAQKSLESDSIDAHVARCCSCFPLHKS